MPLLLALACAEPVGGPVNVVHRAAGAPADLVAAPAPDVPMVIVVDFTDAGDADWRVLYDDAYGIQRAAPARPGPGGAWRAVLTGLRAEMTVDWTLERDGVPVASGTTSTGSLPGGLPTFEVDADDPDEPGWFAGVTSAAGATLAWVIDRTGAISWFYQVHDPSMVAYQVALDPAGDGVWVLVQDAWLSRDVGQVHRVGWDGRLRFAVPASWAHHDLEVDEEGRLVVLVTDFREKAPWGKVAGDALLRIDDRGVDEQVVSAFDAFEVSQGPSTPFYPDAMDWSHGNGLAVVGERGSLWLSLAHLDAIVEVDAEDGAILNILGGDDSSYAFEPPDAAFADQHGINLSPSGTLLCLSTADGAVESVAREYRFDEVRGRLQAGWSYGEGLGILSGFGGGVRRRPDGRTVVTWGGPGLVREIEGISTVTWEMTVPGESLWEVFPYDAPPGTTDP